MRPHEEAEDGNREAREGDERIAEDALREKQAMTSLMAPIGGRIMM
jgi:hypothetical protein